MPFKCNLQRYIEAPTPVAAEPAPVELAAEEEQEQQAAEVGRCNVLCCCKNLLLPDLAWKQVASS